MDKYKTSLLSININKEVKSALKQFCSKFGFKIKKFVEIALIHEIGREWIKIQNKNSAVYKEYEEYGKKTLSSYDDFAESIGIEFGYLATKKDIADYHRFVKEKKAGKIKSYTRKEINKEMDLRRKK